MKIDKYLAIYLSLFFFASCTQTENTLTLIPEGYTGTIKIWFNQKNGIEEKYEGEKRLYEIQENGILKTKIIRAINPTFQIFPICFLVSFLKFNSGFDFQFTFATT